MAQRPTESSEAKNTGFTWKSTILALGLAVFIGSAVVILMDRFEPWGLALMLALILLMVLMLLGLVPWLERRHYLFHPLYIVLVPFGIGYLARSFYIIFGNYEVMVGFDLADGPHYLWQALALISVGVVFLLLGYRLLLGKQLAHKLPIIDPQVNKKRLLLVIVLYLVIGLALYALFIKSLGGITLSLDELTLKRRSSFQFLRSGSWLVYIAVFLGFIYYAKIRRRRIWWLMLAGALLIPLISQARGEVLAILLVVLVGYHHLIHRIPIRSSLLFLGLMLAIAMAMVSQRNQPQFSTQRLVAALGPSFVIERTVGARNFADITTFAHIVRHVDENNDLRMGQTMSSFFTRFVPRAIWPNKPTNIGNEVSELFYNEVLGRSGMAGVPPSLIAELFWNFHLPGVALGMLIFGIFLRLLLEYVRRSPYNPWTVLLYGITLVYIYQLSQGQIDSATFRHLRLLLPTLVAILYITWHRAPSLKSADKTSPAQIVTPKQNTLASPRGGAKV